MVASLLHPSSLPSSELSFSRCPYLLDLAGDIAGPNRGGAIGVVGLGLAVLPPPAVTPV